MYKFNPIYNKLPEGPSLTGKEVKYTVKVNNAINSTAMNFVYCPDFTDDKIIIPMELVDEGEDYKTYEAKHKFSTAGLFWYYFEVFQGTHKFYLQKTEDFEVEPTGEVYSKFQQLVVKSLSKTVDTFKGGVMYHIFVDRFNKAGKVTPRGDLILRDDWGGDLTKNTKDFLILNKECFGGNLKGIEKKLPYLKSLNVSTLYLSPIFESNSYHKYNTADYEKIDSMLGSQEDFISLVKKAKQEDIRIVLDGVFNHTGADSKYFNKLGHYDTVGAYQSKNSPYYNWYDFKNYPDEYSSWWGFDTLPQIKNESQSFAKYIAGKGGIIEKYMKMGILGFRLDVVDELDEKTLNAICKSARGIKPNCIMIGEVWEDASNKIAYSNRRHYFNGNQLDSVMNYPLKEAIIHYVATGDARNLRNTIYTIKDHYPKETSDNLMNILGTHDTERIATVLDRCAKTNGAKDYVKLLKLASLLQYTVMGVPCVFYGDEQGVFGGNAPFCRVCFPWSKENKTIKNWYELLGRLRNHLAFKHGDLNVLTTENELFGFERVTRNRKVVVYTNASSETKTIELDGVYTNYETAKQVKGKIKILPYKYLILTK